MISIFSGTYSESMIVRNILENENIKVFIVNETMSNIEPTISPGAFNPVVLNINSEDFDKAKRIVESYENGSLDLN